MLNAISPEPVQASLIFLAVLVLAAPGLYHLWRRPAHLAQVTLLVILFARTLTHFFTAPVLEWLDDALTVLCLLRAVSLALGRKASGAPRFPGTHFFLGFLVAGVVSSLTRNVDFSVLANGMYLALKGVILGWAFSQFNWSRADIRSLVRNSTAVMAVVFACLALNVIAPTQWAALFTLTHGAGERFGATSLFGPFIHPFDLAFTCSMSVVCAFAYRRHIQKGLISASIIVLGFLATLGSLRRKDLVGLVTAFAVQSARYGAGGLVIVMGLPVAAGVALFAGEFLEAVARDLTSSYLTQGSREARTVLTQGAIVMARDYFPLGSGFGTYGSRTAAVEYSPEYVRLGFPRIAGLGPGTDGLFLSDTSWPAVLGETGVIGTVFFVLGLLCILRAAWKWERNLIRAEGKFIASTVVGWFILTLFQSLGSAVFTSPPMYAFLFGFVGIASSLAANDGCSVSTNYRCELELDGSDDAPADQTTIQPDRKPCP